MIKVLKTFSTGKLTAYQGQELSREEADRLDDKNKKELLDLGCIEIDGQAPASDEQLAEVLDDASQPEGDEPEGGKKKKNKRG